MKKVIAVIPARYGSTRYPGKPLINIGGKTMIQRVYEQVSKSRLIEETIVATDDKRIQDEVIKFGGKVMLTSNKHETGTDRIAEAARRINCEVIVNVQGDEPFIDYKVIDSAIKPVINDKNLCVSTLATKYIGNLKDKNKVKVVFDNNNNALYFSRSIIPFDLKNRGEAEYYKHIGLYVYRKNFLLKFNKSKQTKIEKAESLEQLRILSMGEKIRIVITKKDSLSIDTISDYNKAKKQVKGKTLK